MPRAAVLGAAIVLGAILLIAVLDGCGSSEARELTPIEQRALDARLNEASQASAQGDRRRAALALQRFRVAVVELERDGALDELDAQTLVVGARRVEKRLGEPSTAATQPEQEPGQHPDGQAPPPQPAPSAPPGGEDGEEEPEGDD